MAKPIAILIFLIISAKGYVTPWNSNNQLHPVHGLFVKPSDDGTTGDLYVAATEDNGVKTQWLTDQPVNFLPSAQSTIPVAYASSFPATHDEGSTQKRAVITPPLQYAYALPFSSAGDSAGAQYPYVMPGSSVLQSSNDKSNTPPCSLDPSKANIPQYSPFQFFYPQMMTAYANALSVLKDAGLSDDTANSVMAQSHLWSPYAYPMYVVMDPSAWTQGQSLSTSTTSTKTSSNETS